MMAVTGVGRVRAGTPKRDGEARHKGFSNDFQGRWGSYRRAGSNEKTNSDAVQAKYSCNDQDGEYCGQNDIAIS